MSGDCDDTHRATTPLEMKNSEKYVQRVLHAFQQFVDPFSVGSECQTSLICLSSGQSATDDVCRDMAQYVSLGSAAADTFISTRLTQQQVTFQSPMKKMNLKTFQSMAVSKVVTTADHKKTIQVKAERNLFGKLLMLSQFNDIDLESVFAYQLGPVPWSLATCDGGMVKTNKAQLMHHLETECTASSVPSVDKTVCVVDGNALIQSCVGLPETFAELALQIFNYLPKSPQVHFVTDCYHFHSIKSFERSRRGQSARFCIGGPKTKVPRDFKAFLCNSDNRIQLIRLLLSEWQSDNYAQYLKCRTVYMVCEEKCIALTSPDGLTTVSSPVQELFSSQEEADAQMILHCQFACRNASHDTVIKVRSPDTDVFVVLLAYSSSFQLQVLFDTGTGNNRRLLNINQIAVAIGSSVCQALPALHAFTGCDSTNCFVRRAKV